MEALLIFLTQSSPTPWIVALVCILIAIVVRRLLSEVPSSNPPLYETVPFVGGLLSFLKGPLNLVHNGYIAKGEVFTVPVLHKKMTFLIGPHVATHFFKSSDDLMSQDEVYKFNIPTFGPGVVYDVPHKIRGEQFRIFGEALKTESLMKYLPQFQHETVEFFSKWDNEGNVNLFEKLGQLTTFSAARTLLGREIREQLFDEVAELLHDLDAGMVPISVIMPYLPIAAHRKRDESRRRLKNVFDSVIQKRRASGIKETDMLQHFIDSKYIRCNDGRYLNDDEIGGLLIAALFAGQHTSSVSSSWTGYFLVHNREWWDKCIDEQRKILAEYGDTMNYEVLNSMQVLENCIREALRINPPLLLLLRYVREPFTVTTRTGTEYTVPKGHIAVTSPTYSGRLEHIYSNATKYDPGRFMDPRNEDKQRPYSYLAFGAGRHGCMGHNFAFLQIKTIWSYILRHFDLQPMDPFPEPDYESMVVGIKPCRVSYRRRDLTSY